MSEANPGDYFRQVIAAAGECVRPAKGILAFRSARPPHHYPAEELLSGVGAAMKGGRYNPVGVNVVYLSADPAIAFKESRYGVDLAGALTGFRLLQQITPLVIVPVLLDLPRVLWLDRPCRERLGLDDEDLFGPYIDRQRQGLPVKTQQLAKAAFASGVNAIAYPSFFARQHTNFAVSRELVTVGVNLIALYKDLIPTSENGPDIK